MGEPTLREFAPAAFDSARAGSPAADRLRWAMEDAIHRIVAGRGMAGLEHAVTRLNTAGHDLRLTEQSQTYRKYDGLVAGGQDRLSITVLYSEDIVSASVGLTPAEPMLRSPAELAVEAMQNSFYSWYDSLATVPPFDAYRLNTDDRVVYLAGLLQAEVNNGGFSQYFWNSEMRLVDDTHITLLAIGAEDLATVFARAVNLAPPPDLDADAMVAGLADMDKRHHRKLGKLDDRFCTSPDDIAILALMFLGTPVAGQTPEGRT